MGELLAHYRHLSGARKTYFNFLVAMNGLYLGFATQSFWDAPPSAHERVIVWAGIFVVYLINHAISSAIYGESRVMAAYEYMIFEVQKVAYGYDPALNRYSNVRNFLPEFENTSTVPLVNSLQSILPLFRGLHVVIVVSYAVVLAETSGIADPYFIAFMLLSCAMLIHAVVALISEKSKHKATDLHIGNQPSISELLDTDS